MALTIKDPETDRLARELAQLTGESITVAAKVAIAERLQRVRAQQAVEAGMEDLRAIIARGRRRTKLDQRPVDEILGYAEHGLPS